MRNLIRPNRFLSLALFCVSLAGTYAHAADAPEIRWLYWDQVPTHIHRGAKAGKGSGDLLLQRFQAALPDYNHRNVQVNMPRYHREIAKPNTCVALAWLTHLEKDLVRTKPHSLGAPVGIMTRKGERNHFGPPGKPLSLEQLLKDPDRKLGALANFFYSTDIDRLLLSHPNHHNIKLLKPQEIALDFRLLDYGRVDYILGWNAQLADLRDNGGPHGQYHFHPLEEARTHVRFYAHCQDDPVGRAVIARLDRLMDARFLNWLRDVNAHWVGDPDHYRSLFDHHIINGKTHPDIRDREEIAGN